MNNQKHRCPICGQIIGERKITLFSGMVSALKRVFTWCNAQNKYEFQRKEVKHLFESDNEIARFGDWILFGGLVYRPAGKGKGWYGISKERVEKFFANQWEIPISLWKDSVTGEITKDEVGTIDRIPNLREFLDENREFVAQYRSPVQDILI
jgi:hypothetical protein